MPPRKLPWASKKPAPPADEDAEMSDAPPFASDVDEDDEGGDGDLDIDPTPEASSTGAGDDEEEEEEEEEPAPKKGGKGSKSGKGAATKTPDKGKGRASASGASSRFAGIKKGAPTNRAKKRKNRGTTYAGDSKRGGAYKKTGSYAYRPAYDPNRHPPLENGNREIAVRFRRGFSKANLLGRAENAKYKNNYRAGTDIQLTGAPAHRNCFSCSQGLGIMQGCRYLDGEEKCGNCRLDRRNCRGGIFPRLPLQNLDSSRAPALDDEESEESEEQEYDDEDFEGPDDEPGPDTGPKGGRGPGAAGQLVGVVV